MNWFVAANITLWLSCIAQFISFDLAITIQLLALACYLIGVCQIRSGRFDQSRLQKSFDNIIKELDRINDLVQLEAAFDMSNEPTQKEFKQLISQRVFALRLATKLTTTRLKLLKPF